MEMELEFKKFVVGNRVTGTVIDVEKDTIFMDIGASCDAKIDKQHYSYDAANDFRQVVKVGDEIAAMVTYVNDETILLSRLPFEKEAKFNQIKEKMETGERFTLTFERFNRGGLEHKDVFTYFMPTSQIGVRGAEAKDYVNKPFEVVIISADDKRNQFVVSARKVNDDKYQEKKTEALGELAVGQLMTAKITNVVDAGIELRYNDIIRGFVPRSQLSHLPIEKVTDLYKVGDTVEVKVLELRKNDQFLASVKATQPTPWENFIANHNQDDIVEGTVSRLTEFGAFVAIAPGVEGLVHRSEVTYDEFASFRDLLSVGDTVKAKIISIDKKAEKVGLSIKKLEADPWATLWKEYHVNDIVSVTVKRVERNHMWVNLVQYVDAMVYRKEALLNEGQELSDVYKEGQTLEVKITELNPQRRRIVASLAAIIRDEEQRQLADYREKMQSEVAPIEGALKGKFGSILTDDKE